MSLSDFERVRQSSSKITSWLGQETFLAPEVVVSLGSRFGFCVDILDERRELPGAEIPHFPTDATLCVGKVGSRVIAMLKGRRYLYDGWSVAEVVHATRALIHVGNTNEQPPVMVLTTTAGGVSADYDPGLIVAVSDHINYAGESPLVGNGVVSHVDMNYAYDANLRNDAITKGKGKVRSGVLGGVRGPEYETPAEVRRLRNDGVDVVSMSGVHLDVMAARQLGARCVVLVLVSNKAAGRVPDGHISLEGIRQAVEKSGEQFQLLLHDFLS